MDRDVFPEICVEAVLSHDNETMQKPGIKTITAKKLTRFLLLASLIMLTVIGFSFRALSQTIVEKKAFALSRVIILNIFQTLQKFVKAPLDVLIQNTKYTFTQHVPLELTQFRSREFEHVAKEINHFNREIISNHLLLEEQNETLTLLNDEIETTLKETVFTMGLIEEQRSKESKNHTKRVAEYSRLLASKLALSEKEVDLIATASPLHDIGKMGISDAILFKPDDLNAEEMQMMRSHPEVGFKMLQHSRRDIFKTAAIIAHQHHERWDGSGYPNGLKENAIHLYARVVSLADVFDALFSKRVYKGAWPIESVVDFIKRERGKMFEPRLVDIFLRDLNEFIQIYDKHNEHLGLEEGSSLRRS